MNEDQFNKIKKYLENFEFKAIGMLMHINELHGMNKAQSNESINAEHMRTVESQHNMMGVITGFSITALTLISQKVSDFNTEWKILFTAATVLITLQLILLMWISQNERSIKSSIGFPKHFKSELDNYLRFFFHLVATSSWIIIGILLIMGIW